MTIYNVNEVFLSFQGEGRNAGMQAAFIRAQGCPVGCPWCDSGPYYHPDELASPVGMGGNMHIPSRGNTWPAVHGVKMNEYDLCARIPTDIPMIVITGGEPALQNWDRFIQTWWTHTGNRRTMIALETSGQIEWAGNNWPDYVTVSPKWSGKEWHVEDPYWIWVNELKYVVDDHFTEDIVVMHIDQLREATQDRHALPDIILMPEGAPPKRENIDRTLDILSRHHDWFAGPRMQYDWRVK